MNRDGDTEGTIGNAVGGLTRGDLDMMSKEQLITYVQSYIEPGVKISFSGKSTARKIARRVQPSSSKTLEELCVGTNEDQARNLVLEGENLQAMVTLYKERGQVDLILTDPPYNTGKDFRYNDKWDEDPNDPELGDLVSEDDGARHTKWMKFMWPRLSLMKDMLKPAGVLAICIDHRELFRLGQMLDEMFGESNRLGVINWQRSSTRRNDKEGVSTATEYILIYAKEKTRVKTGLMERTAELDSSYKNPDDDPDGPWQGVSPFAPGRATHPGMVYAVQSPFTGELNYPPGNQCWAYEKPSIKKWLEDWGSQYEIVDLGDGFAKGLVLKGIKSADMTSDAAKKIIKTAEAAALKRLESGTLPVLVFTKKGYGKPRKKTYLNQVKKGIIPSTYWAQDNYDEPLNIGCTSWESTESGTSESGSRELSAVVGDDHGFETVKPLALFRKIIQIWCPDNGLVMDPFSGSGTTAHAVLALNHLGSTRRFIMIEQGRPERGDAYAQSLLADRLKRVVTGDWANGKGSALGGGYRFVQLQQRVDATALLNMERNDMIDTVIASHFQTSNKGFGLITLKNTKCKYLVAKNADNEGFFLVWEGADKNPVFDTEVYESVVQEAIEAGLKPRYHVYARFNLHQSEDVMFYQIPNQILIDFGLSVASDSYNISSDESNQI